MKRTILTGGTGFVGANLARRLLRDGHELHLLVRPGYNGWRIDEIRGEVRLHEVELGDPDGLRATVGKIRPDWVFHLATYGAYPAQTDAAQMIQTNIAGTANLVEACVRRGFEAFVNTGSSSEYGFKDHAPSEDEPLEPNSYYAVMKASATMYCRYTAQRHGVQITTLRLYSVYGPYEEPSRLIPTLIVFGLRNELPPLADPEIARDFVYVDDVCDAYILAASKRREDPGDPGAIYNVGTGVQTTLREVVEVARSVLANTAEPVWDSMEARLWDTPVWIAENRKSRTQLGWQPRHAIEDGLSRTVGWLRSYRGAHAIYGAPLR